MRGWLVVVLLATAASCGADAPPKAEGQECAATHECEQGLQCYESCPCAERAVEKRCLMPGATFRCPKCAPIAADAAAP